MTRPVIGITVDSRDGDHYDSPTAYADAVAAAGGLPLLIPFNSDPSWASQYVDRFAGLLFTGGDDLDPALYGQTYVPGTSPIDPRRQRFELALLAEAERRRLPTLGICLGCQLLNVHRGGSLHQFLPDFSRSNPIEHRKLGDDARRHAVNVELDSQVGRALASTQVIVNTSHKQAVNTPGRQLRVVATAPDGVVEAVEDASFPLFAAVQWHPERLHTEPPHGSLFRLLVERASQFLPCPVLRERAGVRVI